MISVIIPTLNAEYYIEKLLDRVNSQVIDDTIETIVIDSESSDKTCELAVNKGARVINVKRSDFDHGGTRNLAWREAAGDIICFLTQDALPTNEHYIENLTKGLRGRAQDNVRGDGENPTRGDGENQTAVSDNGLSDSEKLAGSGKKPTGSELVMVSGRQIPKADANPVEKLTRNFNYPAESFIRTREDLPRLGIKTYFFSDACSAYKRSILEETGGFQAPILTNEDMLMAARVINKGYAIGYAADARVYHSHNFKLSYQYKRNFDVAAFLTMYKDEIESGGTTGEGMKMVRFTIVELLKQGRLLSVIRCVFESGAKFLGNRAGKKYKSLSREQVLKKTTNPNYWINNNFC